MVLEWFYRFAVDGGLILWHNVKERIQAETLGLGEVVINFPYSHSAPSVYSEERINYATIRDEIRR